MSKEVYGWGADNVCNFYDTVSDEYQLQANQTFDDPTIVKDGVRVLNQPVKRVAGGWQQPTEEEHKAWIEANQKLFPQPEQKPQGPSAERQMINMLGKAQMTQGSKIDANAADIKQVKQMINFIGKQQLAKTTTENGGK
jgi:hypothetical protein